jgi:GNAT superfamily N-acetyltransferase
VSADYTIRCAGLGDLEAAAALFERVAQATFHWTEPVAHSAAAFLRHSESETVWVAVSGGAVIGLAALYEPESFLHSLYVDFGWQGRGVGKALLDIAAEAATGPLSLKVDTRNAPALRFYLRNGFRTAERGESGGSAWIRLERAPDLPA